VFEIRKASSRPLIRLAQSCSFTRERNLVVTVVGLYQQRRELPKLRRIREIKIPKRLSHKLTAMTPSGLVRRGSRHRIGCCIVFPAVRQHRIVHYQDINSFEWRATKSAPSSQNTLNLKSSSGI